MSLYYPQGALTLRILWEDFGEVQNAKLQKIYKLDVLAKTFTVNINDHTQADTFDAEIDFKQFPFDPRAIRACGVTIHAENMKSLFGTGRETNVIRPSVDNTIFQGFVDEEGINFDDSKRTVKLTGRDFTSLLIDRKYVGPNIDLSKNLKVIVQNLLSGLKETEKMTVDVRVKGELPIISQYASDLTALATTKSKKQDETYWQIIQELTARVGLIAYVELDKLVITNPRALYSAAKSVQFVYGKNIKSLEYKRKLGRKKNFNIAVRSCNTQNKANPVMTVYIPKDASSEWSAATGIPQKTVMIPSMNTDGSKGEDKEAPVIALLVPNIHKREKLVEIGEGIYEELGRQQIEGTFETHEMESIDGESSSVDLLKIRNGTPVKIQIDQGDLDGITRIVDRDPKRKQKSIESTRQFLINRGYERNVADALAVTLNNPRFNSPFYTKAVQYTLDAENGFKIKLDFINFIELPKRLGGVG